jgi:hypothetical protein
LADADRKTPEMERFEAGLWQVLSVSKDDLKCLVKSKAARAAVKPQRRRKPASKNAL